MTADALTIALVGLLITLCAFFVLCAICQACERIAQAQEDQLADNRTLRDEARHNITAALRSQEEIIAIVREVSRRQAALEQKAQVQRAERTPTRSVN
jgi:uncharacterized membrane protein YhiD involved in acid resistance